MIELIINNIIVEFKQYLYYAVTLNCHDNKYNLIKYAKTVSPEKCRNENYILLFY